MCTPEICRETFVEGQLAYAYHIEENRLVEDTHRIVQFASKPENGKPVPDLYLKDCGKLKEGASGGMVLDENKKVIGLIRGCAYSGEKTFLVCRVFKFKPKPETQTNNPLKDSN